MGQPISAQCCISYRNHPIDLNWRGSILRNATLGLNWLTCEVVVDSFARLFYAFFQWLPSPLCKLDELKQWLLCNMPVGDSRRRATERYAAVGSYSCYAFPKSMLKLFIIFLNLHFHLTDLFPMHPFFTPWKHQKTVRFSDVFRG